MKNLSILVSAIVFVLPLSSFAVEPLLQDKQGVIRDATKLRVAANRNKQSKAKPATKRKSSKKKNTSAGLQSDGELVQAKKPNKLIGHELTHTAQQQGRMFTSSDFNTAGSSTDKKPKTLSPRPKLSPNSAVISKKANIKKNVKDSHDQFSNMQEGHQAHSIPLENATVSQIRTEQLNNKHRTVTSVRVREKLGAKCNKRDFPSNGVIKRLGKMQAVECSKGKVALKRRN